jgi:hypothetical protein
MTKVKIIVLLIILSLLLVSCRTANPTPEPSTTPDRFATQTRAALDTPYVPPTNTHAPTTTPTPIATPTMAPDYPPEGYGPTDFPVGVNPLTGLKVEKPENLDRRPILVKVQNLPRLDRPQYGLSLADIIYEYYTEYGSTRFAALYYGQDAEQVMPIRSARFMDVNLVRMYKSVFVFGSAYQTVFQRLANSEFSNRLILESGASCPSVCRFEPNGKNYLTLNTAELQNYLKFRGVDNSRPDLTGMYFNQAAPPDGKTADQVYVRFSGAIYNRWDYDPATARYLRFSETRDDIQGSNPGYAQLTDALTKEPISTDNLLIIQVRHNEVDPRPDVEILDLSILGSGPAFIARNGKLYEVKWQRLTESDMLTLVDADGNLFPFKPGQTWIEVFSINATYTQEGSTWRFRFVSDW